MKLIEQYLQVVGRQLPFRGRREVQAELRSLLLDELDERYGADPAEHEVKQMLQDFGSPGAVARRYRGEAQYVIAPGLTVFYFFLLKIVFASIALAFVVLMMLGLVQGGTPGAEVLTFIQRTLSAWVGAFAFVSAGFIVATRFKWVTTIDLEEDWTPEELADIEIEPVPTSRIESVIAVAMILVMMSLLNFFPEIITQAEDLFQRSALQLGHRVSLPVFRGYVLLFSAIWIAELIYYGLILYGSTAHRRLQSLKWTVEGASLAALVAVVVDSRVYVDYSGLAGFRLVFTILLIVQLVETATLVVRAGIRRRSRGDRL